MNHDHPNRQPVGYQSADAHDEWSEDTASNIRGALNFIADALTATGPGMLNEETAHGVARLIMCCTAAMEVTKA